MKITREESRPREVTLTIELEPQDMEPYLHRAYRRVVQRVNIPGFRRGKAPRSLVERYVGRQRLLQEALEFLVPETVDQAVKQEAVPAFDQPQVELEEVDPPRIKAVVPLTPEVDLGDYRGIRQQPEPVEVTEEEVDQALEQLRRDQAPWAPVERPVQFGDLVTLDVVGVVDGRQVTSDQGVEFVPTQNNPLPLPGFSVHLEGLGRGETKEFTLPVPQDYPDQSIAGKECRFTVTVHEVKAKQLPELDDTFAHSVGTGFESLEALREHLRSTLRADRERQARSRFRDHLLEAVVEGASVGLPEMVVEREVDHLLQEQQEALRERRLELEDYLRQVGKSPEELREELRPRAEARLKRSLVVRKLAELEGLAVTDAEVDQEIRELGSEQGGQRLARAFDTPQGRRSLANVLLMRKVLARLEEIATGSAEGAPQVGEGAAAAGPGGQVSEGGTT